MLYRLVLWAAVLTAHGASAGPPDDRTSDGIASPLTSSPQLPASEVTVSQPFSSSAQIAGLTDFSTPVNPPRASRLGDWQAGGFSIEPYGSFWADMVYASERTDPGAYALFVYSRQEQGEDAFVIDARRTRLGLDFSGPRMSVLDDADSGGRLEFDFHGNFVTENRANVLLRHAYWEVKNERFGILVGQSWDVISPLYPSMLNYSVGWLGGNIGFRRAQFRVERFVVASDFLQFTGQVSLNQDIVSDLPGDPGVEREPSDWPVIQARAAVTMGPRGSDADSATLGVSGHIGETGFDFRTIGPPPLSLPPQDDARFTTWSLNADLRVPIGSRTGVQGEFFTGSNLGSFLGGIGQGVCPCLRRPIRSIGGWGEIWFDWTPSLHTHIGFGVDDPNNKDSFFGRTYNQFLFANVVADVTDNLTTGIEVAYWKTLYQELRVGLLRADQLAPSEPGKSVVIDWMVRYSF